jgi:ABC-type multidrug transport system permease subunit
MIDLLITLVIAGLIFYLLFWFIGYIGLPAPFDKVARVIVALVALVFLLNLLTGLGGHEFINWRTR